MTEETNLEPVTETVTEQGVETEELETVEALEETPPEPELIDYEFNGKSLKIPAEIKDSLMMQADYTRKTQELAEQRRQVEQQAAQIRQVDQETMQSMVKLQALDSQLAQFEQVDWNALAREDSAKAQELFFSYEKLKDQRNKLQQETKQKQEQRELMQQQAWAKQLEDGKKMIREKIPDWSDEKAAALVKHASSYGYSAQEAQQISDPRAVMLLHDAYMYQKLKAQTEQQPEKPQPAAKVRTKAPATNDLSKMSVDQWMKARTKQVYG